MKIALITDIHIGARNDSLIWDDYAQKFWNDVFFPYIDKHNIKTVFDLGDTFDRRKYINYNILSRSTNYLFKPMMDRNLDVHIIAGNHDVSYKNTNEVNSPDLLLKKFGFNCYHEATEKEFDGLKVAFLPWICSDNYQESMAFIHNTNSLFLFAHLDIAGFEMNKGGSVSTHGFDKNIFAKFDTVVSGHFHTKSKQGNIFYLGTPYEMTWADYNDPKGFHIFDTETKKFEYIRNPNTLFKKIYYSDVNKNLEDLLKVEDIQGSYVKVIVKDKSNPYWFDMYLDALEKMNPAQLQIVEGSIFVDEDEEIIEGCEDTLTLLRKYCSQIETQVDKKKLDVFVSNLYSEALEVSD